MKKLQIIYRDPEDLRDYENNARTHSDAQVDEIIVSIKTFGFNDPIGIDDQDKIIEGHGRKLAAVKMGLKEVPTISLAHLSEKQRRAYILAHNRIAQNAGWDMDKLAEELNFLVETDIDVEVTGFDEQEIDSLLKNIDFLPEPAAKGPDNPEDEKVPGEKKGRAKSKILHTCPKCNHEFTA